MKKFNFKKYPLILLAVMLVACGQRGPLYLPSPTTPATKKHPQQMQTPPSKASEEDPLTQVLGR